MEEAEPQADASSDLDVGASGGTPTPPTPADPPVFELEAGRVTVVASAEELQQALKKNFGDIEISEHLDLRSLNVTNNPSLGSRVCDNGGQGVPGGGCDHLLYLDKTRSVRGNCSGPPSEDGVTRMGLPASTVQGLQQLAPGQCVLVTSKPAFQTVSGNKWFQNLHIAIVPEIPQNSTETVPFQRSTGMNLFLSQMTFQGAGPGNMARAVAVEADMTRINYSMGRLVQAVYRHSILAHDSRFIDFGGTAPPLLISSESFAAFRNCGFERFDLTREVFDVSFGGMLKLQACTFRDIVRRSATRKLVSTTANNYIPCAGDPVDQSFDLSSTPQAIFFNYPLDDDAYDIQPVPSDPSGVETVEDAVMSDCLRLQYTCPLIATPVGEDQGVLAAYVPQSAPPGCPLTTIAKRSELLKTRCQSNFFELDSRVVDRAQRRDARVLQNAPVTVDPALLPASGGAAPQVDELEQQRAEMDAQIAASCQGYGSEDGATQSGQDGFVYGFIDENHPWLAAIEKVVPEYTHNITEPWAWPQAASSDSSATAAAVGTSEVQGTARSIAVDSALGGSSSSPGLIGGAVGGALAALALLIAAVLVYFCIIRKNKRGSDLEPAVGDAVKGPDTDTHAATQPPGEAQSVPQEIGAGTRGRASDASLKTSGAQASFSNSTSTSAWSESATLALPGTKDHVVVAAHMHAPPLALAPGTFHQVATKHEYEIGQGRGDDEFHECPKNTMPPFARSGSSRLDSGSVIKSLVPADMARHRSAGGDSSRLEGGSSWLKMIPGIFQKNARSVESLPRLESEVLSDNVYESADDTTGLPKGFSSASAYNGLEAQQFSIDMARMPNSEPLPSASTRGPQRLAESCQIRNDRLQLKNKRPPLSASHGSLRSFSEKWGAEGKRHGTPASQCNDGHINDEQDDPFIADLVNTPPSASFLSEGASTSVTGALQQQVASHTTRNTASFLSPNNTLHEVIDEGAHGDIGGESNKSDLSRAEQSPVGGEQAHFGPVQGSPQQPLVSTPHGAVSHGVSLPHQHPESGAAATGPRSLPMTPNFLAPRSTGPRSTGTRSTGPLMVSAPDMSPATESDPSVHGTAANRVPSMHLPEGDEYSSTDDSSSFSASPRSEDASPPHAQSEDASPPQSEDASPPRQPAVQGANPYDMGRLISGLPSSMGEGFSHHMMVDNFGESEFGTLMTSIPGARDACNNGLHDSARSAPAARGRQQNSPDEAAVALDGGRGKRFSPTFALDADAPFAESSLHAGDSFWSESAMRIDALVKTLTQQLDKFGPGDLLLGKFQLLGPNSRRKGGQALVQFAKRRGSGKEYAIKFFLHPDAFYAEARLVAEFVPALRDCVSHLPKPTETDASEFSSMLPKAGIRAAGSYQPSPLSQHPQGAGFLPRMEAIYDVGTEGLRDPHGVQLPPCIVMEKGESLQELLERAAPSRATSLSVLCDVSKWLAEMHEAGYAHRDVKPANVVWLPSDGSWHIIDFGCASRIGSRAPVTFSLTYAAPEVVAAAEMNAELIEVFPEVDVWAFGVMAFELLTCVPAYRIRTEGVNKVMSSLRGEEELPWEDMSEEVSSKLGPLRPLVLAMLNRDPSQRPSMDDFHRILQEYL